MSPEDFQRQLDVQQQQKIDKQAEQAKLDAVTQSGNKVTNAVNKTTKGLKNIKGKVKVTNADLAKSGDVASAVEAINKLNLTTFMQNEGLPQLSDNLNKLSANVQNLQSQYESKGLKALSDQLSKVVAQLKTVSDSLSNAKVQVDSGLQKTIDNLQKSIDGIDFNPSVNVSPPATKIVTTPVDFKPVIIALTKVEEAVKATEIPDNSVDLTPVTEGLNNVVKTIRGLSFPVPNFQLPFQTQTGKDTQLKLKDDGSLPVSGDILRSQTPLFASISASSNGDNTIVAADTTRKIKVLGCCLVAGGTVSVKWKSGSTDVSGSMPLVVNSGFVLPASSPGSGHYFEAAVNNALILNLSAGIGVGGHLSYYLE